MTIVLLASFSTGLFASSPISAPTKGTLLEDLTWLEADSVLTTDTVVVILIGAEAKDHGPHLKLKNDFILAEYFKRRVLEKSDCVIATTVNYHFYPAFVEQTGSTTLTLETARDLIVEICRSLSRYGPRRFYVLNTGVSTLRALAPAADILASEGILLRSTDILKEGEASDRSVKWEPGGTHADEIETMMILYIDTSAVEMSKAVKDYDPGEGGLTRDRNGRGTWSARGVFGDATLATREKGQTVVEAMVWTIIEEIGALRKAPLPQAV